MKRSTATTDRGRFAHRRANRGRRVAVAGGGIGGLTAAIAFAAGGAEVTLFEQAPELTEVGAGIQITPNGARVLSALGMDSALDAVSVRAEAVVPVDALTGRRLARFDISDQPYRFIARPALIGVLAEAARAAGVTLRTGQRLSGPDDPALAALDPVLTVAADGLHSVFRPVLNGAADPFFTGQVAWRAIVDHPAPPEARIWMAPRRHVVTYPLPGGRLNVVMVQEQAEWAPEGWTHPDSPERMQAAFARTAAELREILAKVTETRLWGLFRHPVAEHWHGPGVALLGDAAHPTLPFLAQGANLAIEDAWVLAACASVDPSLDRALSSYQALRRERVSRAIAAANANARNYHLSGLSRRVAQAGLAAIGRLAPGAFLRRLDWLYDHDVTAL